ncbi:NAD(P)-binding protein, partial [Nocardia gipuzkoensis]
MSHTPSILIIGAGFGGLGLALELRRAGIENFTILEKAADLGGVWRENTY